VTIWRELRRGVGSGRDATVTAAARAADSGDWCGFTEAMGGPQQPRCDAPLQLYKRWEARPGRYGVPVGWVIAGVMSSEVAVTTRVHTWTIQFASPDRGEGGRFAGGIRAGELPLEFCQ
jgi:hypothetical protein